MADHPNCRCSLDPTEPAVPYGYVEFFEVPGLPAGLAPQDPCAGTSCDASSDVCDRLEASVCGHVVGWFVWDPYGREWLFVGRPLPTEIYEAVVKSFHGFSRHVAGRGG